MFARKKLIALVALAAASCGLVGCGGGKTNVSGKVTLNGKPVVWGSVTMVDSQGMYYQGPIDLNGTYTIEGVPAGPVKIGVYSPKPEEGAAKHAAKTGMTGGKVGEQPDDPRAKFKSAPPPERPKPPPGAWFPIADKYNDPQNSGLSGEVKAGVPLDIDLK